MHTDRCFAIQLPVEGKKLEKLTDIKKNIFRLVTKQVYWKRTVKRASAILEHFLQEKRKFKIIARNDLLQLNLNLGQEFRLDDSEITTLLKHLHQAGTLLYFEEPALKDTIILDVQWLVDAFKCIVFYDVATEKVNDIERQNFYQTGELYEDELDTIWEVEDKKGKGYKTHKNVLTSYMEKLGLLVCNSEPQSWYYFPSMNRRKFVKEHFKDLKKSSIFLFQFEKKNQLPIYVFYKFVIKCMKLPSWKIHMEKQYRCLYDEVACFSFQGHIVLLCVYNFQIQAQVCHPDNDIDTNLLTEIKALLENAMEEFRIQNYKFDIGYKCQNGKFHEEELNFIPETDLTERVNDRFCTFCTGKHTLESKICWVSLIFVFVLLISES